MAPNRVVAIAASALTLALAVLPVVGNFDWTSTAGIIAGIIAVLGVTQRWLDGWQKHEARAVPSSNPGVLAGPAPEWKEPPPLPPELFAERSRESDAATGGIEARPETEGGPA